MVQRDHASRTTPTIRATGTTTPTPVAAPGNRHRPRSPAWPPMTPGHVYAAGADGGVWRSTTGGGHWTPIADGLPSLSTGALDLDKDGALWYATGEANTGGRLRRQRRLSAWPTRPPARSTPATGSAAPSWRAPRSTPSGSTAAKVWVADTAWRLDWHERTGDMKPTPWKLRRSRRNPTLPARRRRRRSNRRTRPYKNIVNDIAIDPKNPNHLIAAIGWRSGDTYNGFYESTERRHHLGEDQPDRGDQPPRTSATCRSHTRRDGSKLYVMNQSPSLLNKPTAR